MEKSKPIRLQVRLAQSGLASRRHCENYIADGRVSVNGKVVIKAGTKVSEEDHISVDGQQLGLGKGKKIYIALHKPPGFLCANSDPEGRPLAKSLFDMLISERLFHVGRLDYMTSGLLFYTNDGLFAQALTHPRYAIEKEYLVSAKKTIPQEFLDRFRMGITVEKIPYKASSAQLIGDHQARIILTEGKNRELRRVFLSAALPLKKVQRIRIASVSIKGIASGHFRHLKSHEIKSLLKISKPNKAEQKNSGAHKSREKKER